MRFVEGTGKKCGRVTVSIEGEKGAGSPGRGDGGYVYGEEVKNVPMEGRAGKPGMERGKVDGMQDVNEGVEVTPVTLVLRKWIDEWSSCAAQRSENL